MATAISVTSVWIGLAASAMFNFPPSFLIVTIACGIWLIVWLTDRRVRVTAEAPDQPVPPDRAWTIESASITPGAPTLTRPVSKRSRSSD
jgi:zinc/manganese transport system permease protein